MKNTLIISLTTGLLLSGCGTKTSQLEDSATQKNQDFTSSIQSGSAAASVAKHQLSQLFDDHFKENLKNNPVNATFVGNNDYNHLFQDPISEQSIAKQLAFEKKYLAKISAIDSTRLTGQDKLSYDVFKRDREMAIEASRFPSYLMPLNQLGGVHTFYPLLGSGSSAQPFKTVSDYQNFIQRTEGFAKFMNSVVEAYRVGAAKKIVHPEVIVEKIIPQLKAQIVDKAEDSIFFTPVKNFPESFTEQQKQELTLAYKQMIEQLIVPSYKKVHDYLKKSYLKQARSTFGLSYLPDGRAWYEYMIKTHTTLPLNAQELHSFGKQEVARILSEMTQVKERVKFSGDLTAFFNFLREDEQFYFTNEVDLVAGYVAVKDRINAKLPALFEVFPKADYVVKPVEAFRAASSAGASYQSPAPDGSRPGIFYINTHNLKSQPKFLMETLSIHEAAPGHHFQIALQQEISSLPSFRRFGGYTVFSEGWALYAESLGKELGLFSDPYMWYGRLVDEQLRAMRLVLDTGLHAFGWTRQQAIEYMKANSSMAESDIVAEVERYISTPGQALAYKTGERAIRELRNKAALELGDNFDVKKFHTQILIDGALPMPILEKKIDRWIASMK